MSCAAACIFCFCSPVPLGPAIGHLRQFSSIFMFSGYHAPVFRPRSMEVIVVIATWVLRGMGRLWHERAHPVGRRPRFSCFAEVQGTLFLPFGQFTNRGFSATTFLGARRVLWSRTPRHHATLSSVLSSCPTPQSPTRTRPALWSCWVPLNVFRCRIPAPIPAAKGLI